LFENRVVYSADLKRERTFQLAVNLFKLAFSNGVSPARQVCRVVPPEQNFCLTICIKITHQESLRVFLKSLASQDVAQAEALRVAIFG
jgi:hypothetical protein